MRAISEAYEALLSGQGVKRVRVQVKDSGGTFRDLSTFAGPDMVLSASWNENVDSNGHDCSISLRRASEKLSLSPFMQKSPLNLGFAFPGTYAPLIDLAREVKVEWSVAGTEAAPTFVIGFHGYIDSFNPASGSGEISITARGQYQLSLDTFIERERIYAFADPADADSTKGLRSYVNGDTWVVNELAVPSDAKRNVHFYKVTSITTGIGGTEGAWPTGAASSITFGGVTFGERGATTVVTGTPVETVMQQILNDNMSAPPTLTTPVSPSWLIRWYQQARTGAFQAIRALADQIGWDLRYYWNAGLGDYRLELRDVPRTKTVPDRTFAPSQRFKLNRLETKLEGIRNVIRVIFLDSQDLDAGKFPKRKVVEVSDATSITKYGRRFMEVSEGKTSNIDSTAEATTLANAILADLKDPVAEMEVELPFFPFVELHDLYRFTADGIHYDVDQDLAVVSYRHDMSGVDATTTLTCRGKPSGGYTRWLKTEAGRGSEETHTLVANVGSLTTLTVDPGAVGGAKMKAQENFSKHAIAAGFEFHVSRTPSFTPDNTTLIHKGLSDEHTFSTGTGGETYYGQTVPWYFNAGKMVRGQPSTEVSFVAGQGNLDKLSPEPRWGRQPLNGGFELQADAAKVPDHWDMITGTWGTEIQSVISSDARSGDRAMKLNPSAACDIRSEAFQTEVNRYYEVTWYAKNHDGGTGSMELYVKFYSDKGITQVDEIVVDTIHTTSDPSFTGVWGWQRRGGVFQTLNLGQKWARIGVRRVALGGSTSTDFRFDSIEVKDRDSLTVGEETTSNAKSTTSATLVAFGAEADLNLNTMDVGGPGLGNNDVNVWFSFSCFVTSAGTGVEFLPRMTDLDGTVYDGTPVVFYFNNASVHHAMSGVWSLARPQNASYGGHFINVKMMWRRFVGAGTITMDNNDSCCFLVK